MTDQALPRPVSDEPTLLDRLEDEADLCANEGAEDIATLLAEAIGSIRTLVSERDALAVRVRELEAERDRALRNRDMWKGQCERQAEQLTRLRGERQVLVALMGELLGVALTIQAEGDDKEAGLQALIQRTRNAISEVKTGGIYD